MGGPQRQVLVYLGVDPGSASGGVGSEAGDTVEGWGPTSFCCGRQELNPTGGLEGGVSKHATGLSYSWVFSHDSHPELIEDCPPRSFTPGPLACLSHRGLGPLQPEDRVRQIESGFCRRELSTCAETMSAVGTWAETSSLCWKQSQHLPSPAKPQPTWVDTALPEPHWTLLC